MCARLQHYKKILSECNENALESSVCGMDVWTQSPQLKPWWRHQMEKFAALLALCAVNSPIVGEFVAQSPVKRNFDVFFHLRSN